MKSLKSMRNVLAVVQEGPRAGEASDKGDYNDRNDEAEVTVQLLAVSSDGGELAGPERDGGGGVRLNGQEAAFEQGGESDEAAAAGDGIDESAEERGKDEQEDASGRRVEQKSGVHGD